MIKAFILGKINEFFFAIKSLNQGVADLIIKLLTCKFYILPSSWHFKNECF